MSTALFLDRDGTLIKHIPYLSNPAQVELLPGVKEALEIALNKGFKLFLFTNQSGVGRGYYSLEQVHACNQAMFEQLGIKDNVFTEICIAPEAPDEPVVYRKPSPRFIDEMVERYNLDRQDCYMIGDSTRDIEAARNGRIHGVFIHNNPNLPDSEQPSEKLLEEGIQIVGSLLEFVKDFIFTDTQ